MKLNVKALALLAIAGLCSSLMGAGDYKGWHTKSYAIQNGYRLVTVHEYRQSPNKRTVRELVKNNDETYSFTETTQVGNDPVHTVDTPYTQDYLRGLYREYQQFYKNQASSKNDETKQ